MPTQPPLDKDKPEFGFTKSWLTRAFGLSRWRVDTLMDGAEPCGKAGKALLFDITTASKRLMVGEVDWDAVLKTVKKRDLPVNLQTEIWSARRAELKFKQEAGDLWPTSAVLGALSEIFGLVRSTLRIWSETVERQRGLTVEQRQLLIDLTDQFLSDLRDKVLELARENATESAVSVVEEGMDGG